jgi:hypothetical protein
MPEDIIHDIMINNRIPQSITQASVHAQPGMFPAESVTGAQMVAPGRAVHVFIELVIQITFHHLLFQPAKGTARLAARFQ